MSPPLTLKPMSSFDPTQPALLHDQLNEKMVPWSSTPEEVKSWRQYANSHSEGLVEWDGLLLDGWCALRGG